MTIVADGHGSRAAFPNGTPPLQRRAPRSLPSVAFRGCARPAAPAACGSARRRRVGRLAPIPPRLACCAAPTGPCPPRRCADVRHTAHVASAAARRAGQGAPPGLRKRKKGRPHGCPFLSAYSPSPSVILPARPRATSTPAAGLVALRATGSRRSLWMLFACDIG